jgi:hypothetical protein
MDLIIKLKKNHIGLSSDSRGPCIEAVTNPNITPFSLSDRKEEIQKENKR